MLVINWDSVRIPRKRLPIKLVLLTGVLILDMIAIYPLSYRGQKTASTSDLSDTCSEFTASTDEVPKPAPPDMFANKSGSLQYGSLGNITLTETYEDENGDPYSVV